MYRKTPPDSPDADRFFARLLSAILECPRCGVVDRFSWQASSHREWRRSRKRAKERAVQVPPSEPAAEEAARELPYRPNRKPRLPPDPGWNPTTGVWRCPQCGLACILGILAWPIESSKWVTPSRPRDQVPSERELVQLRSESWGRWLAKAYALPRRRAPHSNIVAGCLCEPGTAHTNQCNPECPIHGGEAPPPPTPGDEEEE